MNIPPVWLKHEDQFKQRIYNVTTKAEAMKYIYTCANYFIDAGCTEDEVEQIERAMKKIVREWVGLKFGFPAKESSTPVTADLNKNIFEIKYFEPDVNYIFECTGTQATRTKSILKAYQTRLTNHRKTVDSSRGKEPITLKLVKIVS
jgi:hypothetical protein